MKRDDAFRVLLWLMLIISEVPAVPVPPPTDVEVSCQNLQVRVRWNHSSAHPQSSFGLTVTGPSGIMLQSETTERQYDLTPFVWSSEEHYMSNFGVTVTATVGGNQSEPASSETFTFNNIKTANRICQLDFPPAELLRKNLETTLRFPNPFHLHRELERAARRNSKFRVTINSETGRDDFSCGVKENVCKHDVVIPDGVRACVTLTGVFFEGDDISQVKFHETEPICAVTVAVADPPWIVIGIALLALCVVVTVVIVAVKKCSSEAPVDLSVVTQWFHDKKPHLRYATVSPVDASMVYTTPRRSREPSLTSGEYLQDSLARGLAAVGGFPEGRAGDDDSADDSENTTRVSVHSAEPEELAYDCGHVPVDMGNGDVAIGYKE